MWASRGIMALLLLGATCGEVLAQTQTQTPSILGVWTLVSVTVDRDGNKSQPFGTNPKGLLIFEKDGHFSLVAMRNDLPKMASNNRMTATPTENRQIVRGSTAYFGTYTASDADRTFTLHVEGATFPNWIGTDQKRIFTITGDQLRYTNSSRSGGEGTSLVVWKRLN
jgi:hypothetical protein